MEFGLASAQMSSASAASSASTSMPIQQHAPGPAEDMELDDPDDGASEGDAADLADLEADVLGDMAELLADGLQVPAFPEGAPVVSGGAAASSASGAGAAADVDVEIGAAEAVAVDEHMGTEAEAPGVSTDAPPDAPSDGAPPEARPGAPLAQQCVELSEKDDKGYVFAH